MLLALLSTDICRGKAQSDQTKNVLLALFAQKAHVKTQERGCMNMADMVPASEFTRNFGRYRMLAQREAVAVSSHGSVTGYFVAPEEYEEFRRFKQRRHSFATAELSDEKVAAIAASRMDDRHAHLAALLDSE